MPGVFRLASESDLNVWLKFRADTAEAEQKTRELGQVANEMTSEQFVEMQQSQQGLLTSAKEIEKATAQIQRNWWRTQRVLRASAYIFRSIMLAGTAMWAPIIAGAVSYAKEIEKIDDYSEATADAWLKQTKMLENAKLRIGRVSAQVLQPYLETVVRLANRAAGLVEEHPELIEAALKTGVAVTTVGVLGALVTAGIKMVIDVKFVAAAATMSLAAARMERSADKMLAAATGQAVGGGTAAAAGGATGLAKLTALLEKYIFTTQYKTNVAGRWFDPKTGRYVSTAAVGASRLGAGGAMLGGIGAGLITADLGYQASKQARAMGLGDIVSNFAPLLGPLGAPFGVGANLEKVVAGFHELQDAILGTGNAAKKGAEGVASLADNSERLQREGEGARIILELQRELAKSAAKYEQDRADAIESSNKKIVEIQDRYSSRIEDAWRTMNENIADITANYNKVAGRAEEDYLLKRRDVVKDAHEQAQREEEQFRERLRQLRLDHEERVDELVRARDALGLVKEERKYQRDVDEATRAHNLKLRQEKKETRDRLKEIDQRYKLERRRRYEDYIQRVQEEHERYLEARKEATKQRDEELKENREALKEKLADLREAYEQEKREAVNAAYEKIVLLRGAYDAELRLRQQYHGLILQSTEQFLEQMLQTFDIKSGQLLDKRPVPEKQTGGFIAGTGIYKLHAGEYVMNPSVTRAAEHALGGRLNDRRLMSALGGGTTINLAFPGGLITRHELASTLKQNRAELLQMLERELA